MTRFKPGKLYKDPLNGRFMGVCAGLADFFDVRVGAVRFLTVIGSIFFFPTIPIIYIIVGFLLERKPADLYEDERDEAFWRTVRTRPDYTMVDLRRRFREVERRTRNLEAYVTSRQFRLNRELSRLED